MSTLRPLIGLLAFLAAAAGLGYLLAQLLTGALGDPGPPRGEPTVERIGGAVTPTLVPREPETPPWASEWIDLNNAAAKALEEGNLERALEMFERCVEAEPDNRYFRNNLAETLARLATRERDRTGDLESALAYLERALEYTDREDLATLFESWRREADVEKEFWTSSTLHFDLVYDVAHEELFSGHGQALLDPLERAYGEFYSIYGSDLVGPGDTRVKVVIYQPEDFDRVTGLGDWAGGVFDGTIRLPLKDLANQGPTLERVLRHELSHAFTRHVGGRDVPGWLNEGLAQLLEGPTDLPLERAHQILRDKPLFALGDLQGSLASWPDIDEISRAYAQSLALAAHIEQNLGRGSSSDQLLITLIKACNQGRTCEDTFETEVGYPLTTLLEDFAAQIGAHPPEPN